jgi:hypothetical protein
MLVRCTVARKSREDYLRLQESVAAFELLVLVLDDFHAIDNLHEAGLQLLGLSSDVG